MDNTDNNTTEYNNQDDDKLISTDKQGKNKGYSNILPYQFKKGQSGNPAGRPKGKTLKEYARELLQCQTEEERQEFLAGIPKEKIWEMAEGKADTKGEMEVTLPNSLIEIIKNGTTNQQGNSGLPKED